MSHPTWVRGLKLMLVQTKMKLNVAPYVGAWIETKVLTPHCLLAIVAPYVGAWIETKMDPFQMPRLESRTLRGCVD